MFYFLIVDLIQFFLISVLCIDSYGNNGFRCIKENKHIPIILCLVLAIALSPVESGSDKYIYIYLFNHVSDIHLIHDFGWNILTKLLYYLTFGQTSIYLIILALIYVLSYHLLAKHLFSKDYSLYFILVSSCCLGFWSGAVNIMRFGIATSFFFYALAYKEKKVIFIIFSVIAISIHASILLIIVSFLITHFYSNYKLFFSCWFVFVICSALNLLAFVINIFSSHLGSIGDRINEYASLSNNIYVNAGFRIDFVIYSLYPILYSYWIINKKEFFDEFYERIVNIYIIANCFWLVMIRVPFGDRFALLSWIFIPFIILYPFMKKGKNLEFDKRVVFFIMIPVTLYLMLSLR